MPRLIVVSLLFGITLVVAMSSLGDVRFWSQSSATAADESTQQLTIYGVGSVTAPADALDLQFIFEYWDDWGRGRSLTVEERLEPMIDVAIGAGVAEEDISVPMAYGHYGILRLNIHLDSPDPELVRALISDVTEISREEDMPLIDVGGRFEYGACDEIESDAYAAAIDDARNRAERVASVLEMSVAEVNDVSDQSQITRQSSTCDPPVPSDPSGYYMEWFTRGYSSLDPDQDLVARAERVVHVTYSIR